MTIELPNTTVPCPGWCDQRDTGHGYPMGTDTEHERLHEAVFQRGDVGADVVQTETALSETEGPAVLSGSPAISFWHSGTEIAVGLTAAEARELAAAAHEVLTEAANFLDIIEACEASVAGLDVTYTVDKPPAPTSTSTSTDASPVLPLISVTEAARLLNMKPWPAYKLVVKSGKIRHGRIGKRIVVSRPEVERYAVELLA